MTLSIPLVTLPGAGTGRGITGRLRHPAALTLSRLAVLALVSPPGHGSQPVPPGRPRTAPACGCATPPPGCASWPRPPPR